MRLRYRESATVGALLGAGCLVAMVNSVWFAVRAVAFIGGLIAFWHFVVR